MMFPPMHFTSSGNGDTMFHKIKLDLFLSKIFWEFLTSSFQEFDIRGAIIFHFLQYMRVHIPSNFILEPGVKFSSFVVTHTVMLKRVAGGMAILIFTLLN